MITCTANVLVPVVETVSTRFCDFVVQALSLFVRRHEHVAFVVVSVVLKLHQGPW